ncbi:MAG TPA: ATP12 family protein [Alphaproteobacteria bacterium]|nr:ATP12 family protein [Alphaproteobacteria bacterium]
MKRFYKQVTVAAADGGFQVTLDGKPIRTPRGEPLTVPSRALADGIAAEWDRQGDEVKPDTMPLLRLSATAIDGVRTQRALMIDAVARYAETDLLCYRAEGPSELVRRQDAVWGPLLAWADQTYGARFALAAGLMPVGQPAESVAALRRAVEAQDDFWLSGLQNATGASGSLIIGLAMLSGRLDGVAAFAAAELDETYQIEQWGEDPLAQKRRDNLLEDLQATADYFDRLR